MARRGPKPGTIMPRAPHDTIRDGKGAVGVLLSNRPWHVWVDQGDFDRIVAAYGNQSWSWVEASQYVRLRPSQAVSLPVARLVVGEAGRFIRYGDGDRLNLRGANLSVEEPVRPGAATKRALSTPDREISKAPRMPRVKKPVAVDPLARPQTVPPRPPQSQNTMPKRPLPVVAAVKRIRVPAHSNHNQIKTDFKE